MSEYNDPYRDSNGVLLNKHIEECKAYQEDANIIFHGLNPSIRNVEFAGYRFDVQDAPKQETKHSPPSAPKGKSNTPPTFKP